MRDLISDWPDALAVAHVAAGLDASAVPDNEPAQRIMVAALSGDPAALAGAIDAVPAGALPDLRFLADWAGFWGLGPSWSSPHNGARPQRTDWAADAEWLAWRRSAEAHANRPSDGIVPLDASDGPLRCSGTANGRRIRAFLDTGAPTSLISHSLAKKLNLVGLCTKREVIDGSGQRAEVSQAILADLTLGSWHGQNLPVDIAPLAPDLNVDAILSPFDLFSEMSLTFDFEAWQAYLGEACPEDAMRTNIYWSEGTASLKLFVGDKPVWMLVDTGAGGVVLDQRWATQSGLMDRQSRAFESATALGSTRVTALGRLPLTLGELPPVMLPAYSKPPSCVIRQRPLPRLADGLLGISWLRRFKLHVPANRRLLFLTQSRGLDNA